MIDKNIPIVFLAILPVYIDGCGSGTELIDIKGESVIIKSAVKSILKKILKEYVVDINALKNKYAKSLGIKNAIPLPLTRDFTLIPLKTRKPMVLKDSAYGYIYYEKIKKVFDNGISCTLDLGNYKIKNTSKESIC
ncbi:hypothetical protein [Aceticella autotrophica]|uniref:hypothetical protein n=1 Tax=Aceticella autotrophica TaxID=2755338 RepID=UPI00254274E2|nr:hypothetical protein [Aceticella autotrophica]